MKSDIVERAVEEPEVDKRGERVRAMFAGVARRYDLLNHLLSLNIDKAWRRFTIRTVPPAPGMRILDVCTGTGDLALGYDSAASGQATVTGADFCHEMLVLAKEKNQRLGRRVEMIEADAQRLPFANNEFDIVTVAFGLRNVADTNLGLKELVRVAKVRGKVAILEFSRPRTPVLRWLYLAYFRYLLPAVGQAISKSSHDAYHYLPASVLSFPDGEEMLERMRRAGLEEVVQHPRTFGIATLYVGQKVRAEEG